MNYDLHHPCDGCPFLKEGGVKHLHKRRVHEIADAMATSQGSSFACHKTVDYSEDGAGEHTKGTQHCAGALLFMEHVNPSGNQMSRWMERLGFYDRTKYTGSELVYDTVEDFVEGQQKGLERK